MRGNDSVIFFGNCTVHADIETGSGSTLFIGDKAERGPLNINVSEGQCAVIGDGNTFGEHIWCRTSDQHAIFDADTRKRINPASSVVISDGAVIGDGSVIMKGAVTADGAVYEAGSLIRKSRETAVSRYAQWPQIINKEKDTRKRARTIKKLIRNR